MSLPPLPSFADFFEATHGYEPYPWQRRLATEVLASGRWPETIGLPTGTGKTAALDVALYALAAEAGRPAAERVAPIRIVMVVDRRTIVDQSFQRAMRLRSALLEADTGPLAAIRERLGALMGRDAGYEDPLQIALLRGGVPRDDGWARRPDQALIALSTVDQVGSRLLFRGYGVRPTMQALHAGLLGHDTLFLLDEVHLARPFRATLSAMADRWRQWREVELPDRWQVVCLSATSGEADRAPFTLDDSDRSLPRLQRRLRASKPVTTRSVESRTHDRSGRPHRSWIGQITKEVEATLGHGARCACVMVNRVDTARAVADKLRDGKGARPEILLVTGRMRGLDRSRVILRLVDRAGPGWADRREAEDAPFVCVSTQCLEAGADLDFDALITEISALDSLVQRFGRANRSGDHEQARITVLAPKDVDDLDDPIYGKTLGPTWRWLQERGEDFDACVSELEILVSNAPIEALAPHNDAAVLLPPHLDLLSQTAPTPHPDPDPALYLHGLKAPRAEVHVIWRADVVLGEAERATARLCAVPPTSQEALALPLGAAKRWLVGEAPGSFGDVGGDADDGQDLDWKHDEPIALVWDGSSARPAVARDIRPGATLIVAADRGGLSDGNFASSPDDERACLPVEDVGDLGRTLRSGRPVLRLDERVHGVPIATGDHAWPEGLTTPPAIPDGSIRSVKDGAADVRTWVEAATPPAGSILSLLLGLLRRTGYRVEAVDGTWILFGRRRLANDALLALARDGLVAPGDGALSADDRSWLATNPIPLDRHLAGVGTWARSLAEGCGLPPTLIEDLERAGRWHDIGKAHVRFQVLLHDGDEIRAAASRTLAKSGSTLRDRQARQRARARSRLPGGFRHEMASVALLTSSDEGRSLLRAAHDQDLVLHLVASHHGHARPFAPTEEVAAVQPLPPIETRVEGMALSAPGDHQQDRVDSGVAERFWRLQRRYGWWGLAWLEAILRLADHRQSEAEERPTTKEETA